jgi:gamma-glutamyl hydrolase
MSKTIRKKKTKEGGLVVGVITMPHAPGKSHIMKSYVDWLEGEGVQVVPVPFDTPYVEFYYEILHGLVIPGGDTEYGMKQSALLETVERFLDLGMRKGEYFPILGICFGMELLAALIGEFRTFEPIVDHGQRQLTWTREGITSAFYRALGPAVKQVTEQNHEFGISSLRFQANVRLRRFFSVLATATNVKKEEYVAIIQGRKWPVYGMIFHPERQENRKKWIRFFVSEFRKCKHVRGLIQMVRWKGTSGCVHYPEHAERECYFF